MQVPARHGLPRRHHGVDVRLAARPAHRRGHLGRHVVVGQHVFVTSPRASLLSVRRSRHRSGSRSRRRTPISFAPSFDLLEEIAVADLDHRSTGSLRRAAGRAADVSATGSFLSAAASTFLALALPSGPGPPPQPAPLPSRAGSAPRPRLVRVSPDAGHHGARITGRRTSRSRVMTAAGTPANSSSATWPGCRAALTRRRRLLRREPTGRAATGPAVRGGHVAEAEVRGVAGLHRGERAGARGDQANSSSPSGDAVLPGGRREGRHSGQLIMSRRLTQSSSAHRGTWSTAARWPIQNVPEPCAVLPPGHVLARYRRVARDAAELAGQAPRPIPGRSVAPRSLRPR